MPMRNVDVNVMALSNFPVDTKMFTAADGNVGVDLYAATDASLRPGERCLIPTGLAFDIPEGSEIQVRPRSGLALRCGLTVVNSPGTVDPNYRGEVGVIALNTEPVVMPSHYTSLLEFLRDGNSDGAEQLLDEFFASLTQRTIQIRRGERFAQAVFAEYLSPHLTWCTRLGESVRGLNGYGSSGTGLTEYDWE